MPGRQTGFNNIEFVDIGAKPGCLDFLNKAGLDQTPVAPLMLMMSPISFSCKICPCIPDPIRGLILGFKTIVYYEHVSLFYRH